MNDSQKPATGMCIPCSVRETADKGLGVFTESAVRQGARVWRHVPGLYEALDEAGLARLLAQASREDAVDLLVHIVTAEAFPGYMVRHLDEGALINHGDLPNVMRRAGRADISPVASTLDVSKALLDSRFDLVAARDLAAGDELLMDYNAEPDDPEYFEEACRRYGVTRDWL